MVDVGIWALIYGFAAIGLSLLMGLAGQVGLGHAAFIAVGAYTQALLVAKANLNPLLAAPISVVAAMLVALLVGLPLLRLRGHFLALATSAWASSSGCSSPSRSSPVARPASLVCPTSRSAAGFMTRRRSTSSC